MSTKRLDLAKQYTECALYDRVLPVFSGKHKSKTAMHAALGVALDKALNPYGFKFDSDKGGVDMKFEGRTAAVVLTIKPNGPGSSVEFTVYTDGISHEDAAARLCARIASAVEDILFWRNEIFECVGRTGYSFSSLPALAADARARHLFVCDAADKVAMLEHVLPVPNRLHEGVLSVLSKPGTIDAVDVERLAVMPDRHTYSYNYRHNGFAQASTAPEIGAFKVSDDIKTRWLSVSSWSERLTMYYALDRAYMHAYMASLSAFVTAMLPSVCQLGEVNPPRRPDDVIRRDEQTRIREFAEFVYHNARPPMQALEDYTRTVLEGTAKPRT